MSHRSPADTTDDLRQLRAITREVAPSIAHCELTHLARTPIDLDRARAQHAAYERILTELGCAVQRIAADAGMPDSVFVEDIAVVLDEIAVITRPGVHARRAETSGVEETLRPFRPMARIEPPATIDGGDVLVLGRSIFIGQSQRTNNAGIVQMQMLTRRFGYSIKPVPVHGCLHLKSAVTSVGDRLLLVNSAWLPLDVFRDFEMIDVHPTEAYAANVLRVEETLVSPDTFPRTRERLERRDLAVRTVGVSELQKAEGAVTCCSLIFKSAVDH